jgi:hypothetical protein
MRGRWVQATAEAFAINQLITKALTAIACGHRLYGRRAHIPRWCRWAPILGMWSAWIARREILVPVQLPREGPRS